MKWQKKTPKPTKRQSAKCQSVLLIFFLFFFSFSHFIFITHRSHVQPTTTADARPLQ
jgi:hypothetical protein